MCKQVSNWKKKITLYEINRILPPNPTPPIKIFNR